jgi:membrane protease YdiL (CAAX protease family)
VTSDHAPDGSPPPSPPRPGSSIFTIEGRAAPGLFVVGWLASLLGLGLVFVGAMAGSGLFLYFLGPTLLTVGLVAGAGNQAIERRVRCEAYAGPSPYLVFAAAIAAVYAVGSIFGVALHLVLGSSTLPGYVVRLIGVTLQAVVFIGIVRLTVVDNQALSWREMGWRRPDAMAIRDLAFGALLAVPVIFLTTIVAAILVPLFQVAPESPLPPTGVAAGLAVQLMAGAIIAPIAEETMFRGFAISAWERTVGVRGAIVRASVLFALAHVLSVTADNSGQAIGLIVVGFATRLPVALALGALFVDRRSIWAPLGLHIAFNAILLVLGELAVSAAG